MKMTREGIISASLDQLNDWIDEYVMEDYEGDLPNWSTDVSAAWKVVEQMNGPFGFFVQRNGDYFYEGPEWEGWEAAFGSQPDKIVKAKKAPEAICKAALLAVLEGSK